MYGWNCPCTDGRAVLVPLHLWASLACAIGVFASGFGVMTSLWYALPRDPAIPGHWDYLSATVGDAVVLPALAGSLAYSVLALPPTPWDQLLAAVGGLTGAVVGAFVQFSWLADPRPRRNWVLPRPGRFSAPGWYHAFFLVVLSGAICAAYCVLLVRLRSVTVPAQVADVRWSIGLYSACAPAFLGLVIADSRQSAETSSSRATIAVCTVTFVAAVVPVWLATLRFASVLLPVQLAGVVTGIALAMVALVRKPRPALPRSNSMTAIPRRNAFAFALAVRRAADFNLREGRSRLFLLAVVAVAFAAGATAWWAWPVLAIAGVGSWQGWGLSRAALENRTPRNRLIRWAYDTAVNAAGRHAVNLPGVIEGISCLTLAMAVTYGVSDANAALIAFACVMGYAVSHVSHIFVDNANYNPNDAPFFGFEFLRKWCGPALVLLAAATALPHWRRSSLAAAALVCALGLLASVRVRETDRAFRYAYLESRESERLAGRDDVLNQVHGISMYLDRALALGTGIRPAHPDVYEYVQAALVRLQQLTALEDPYVDDAEYPASLSRAVRRFARSYGAWERSDIRVPWVPEPDHRLARILVHDLVGNAGKAGASRIVMLFETAGGARVRLRVQDDAPPFPPGSWMAPGSSLARLGRTLEERSGSLLLEQDRGLKAVTATWRLHEEGSR